MEPNGTDGALEALYLTQAAYATRIGKSRQYVGKLKGQGRLVLVTRGGREYVDVVATDKKLAATADPTKGPNGSPAITSSDPDPVPADGTEAGDSYKASRAKREAAEAELKQLKLDEARGRLIDRETVEATVFGIFRTQRDRLTAMTGVIAKRVTTLETEEDCAAVIREEVQKALNASADEFEREGLAQEGSLTRPQ